MFIIVKQTKTPIQTITAHAAYSGPACHWVGAEPANQYVTRKAAEIDAAYLQRASGGNFSIHEIQ